MSCCFVQILKTKAFWSALVTTTACLSQGPSFSFVKTRRPSIDAPVTKVVATRPLATFSISWPVASQKVAAAQEVAPISALLTAWSPAPLGPAIETARSASGLPTCDAARPIGRVTGDALL